MFTKVNKFLNNLYSYSGYIAAFFLILVAVFILIGISSRIFGFYIRGLAEYSGYSLEILCNESKRLKKTKKDERKI